MGLLQQIAEDKAKLAEMMEGEIIESEDDVVIEEEKEPENDNVDEEVAKEPEAVVEAEEATEEKPLDGKDYARMRRERREARKAELEAEERNRQPVQVVEKEVTAVLTDPEPDRATQYPQWLEWNTRQANEKAEKAVQKLEQIEKKEKEDQLIQSAVEDFQAIENEFKKIEPNYDAAADFYLTQLSKTIQVLYPQASKKEIAETIKIQVLNKAAMYHSQGLDPAEELFEEAVSLGFNPSPVQEKEIKKEIKPDLDKIASNRARNAGMNASGGVVKKVNLATAATMTTGEWAKLSKAEKDAILKGGR